MESTPQRYAELVDELLALRARCGELEQERLALATEVLELRRRLYRQVPRLRGASMRHWQA
jgi:hypothetical protein